ncbi:MAG: HIRAN domain-containing protein [bacterium]
MTTVLILAWQNPHNRGWVPVGRLQYKGTRYIFQYTIGAKQAKDFVPFNLMTDLASSYESEELFPIFQNRLLSKSRPEYNDYLNWLSLEKDTISPFEELARTGGIRATDSLQLFPIPEERNGKYEVIFFAHGISHLAPGYIEKVNQLSQGTKLYVMRDIQNEFAPYALTLRTGDTREIAGYCPRFFTRDFGRLIDINGAENVEVTVVKVNVNSPLQFKLLCKLSTSWPSKFVPFADEIFQPIIDREDIQKPAKAKGIDIKP